jgi:hypothetical protein
MKPSLSDHEIPYFCWDRPLTVGEIKQKLRTTSGTEHERLVAWILREAAFDDVWQFVSPSEVSAVLPHIEPFLGRKREFWNYIIREWHALEKL